MNAATREFVRRRAGNRCGYCRLPQQFSVLTHHVEHIVARQHGGDDHPDNLALARHRCNRKGPNLAGIDPVGSRAVALFHPRRDRWNEHFRPHGVTIEGISPVGRVTVRVLDLSDSRRLELRAELLMIGELGQLE